jgi:hypothetical protein
LEPKWVELVADALAMTPLIITGVPVALCWIAAGAAVKLQ